MKNWLRRKLQNFLDGDKILCKAANSPVARSEDIDSDRSMSFNIMFATGGIVIKSYRYDRKTDRSNNSLYVIREDQDLAHELSRIITVESMR